MNTHDVNSARRILLRICENLSESLGRRDVYVKIKRRNSGTKLVEEERLYYVVVKLESLFGEGFTAEILRVNSEVGGVAAVEFVKGELHVREHSEAETVRRFAVKRIDSVAEHIAALSSVGS